MHTAQGKEARLVIIVLGGNPSKPGAKAWAAQTPNLLNVAVSRAKERLYVVGDRTAWARQPYFRTLVEQIPVRDDADLPMSISALSAAGRRARR